MARKDGSQKRERRLRLEKVPYAMNFESMRALEPKLCYWEPWGRLPEDLSIKIFRESGVDARSQATQVCNLFNTVIKSGRVRGAFDVKGGSISAGYMDFGEYICDVHSVICTSEGLYPDLGVGNMVVSATVVRLMRWFRE